MELFCVLFMWPQEVVREDVAKPVESSEDSPASTGLNTQEVLKLIGIFEHSISFLLLQLIKLSTTNKRKLK